MSTEDARDVVDRYFAALARKDFGAMRPLLHDDVVFKGVLGSTAGAEGYIHGLRRMMASMTRVERRVIVAEGEDVMQVYDLVLGSAVVTLSIAQWLTVRDGWIAVARVYVDPRPLLQSAAS